MENENSESSSKNKVVWIVVAIVALAVVGYFFFGKSKLTNPVQKVESAVTINGTVIPKTTYDTQLATAIASYKTQGVDVTDATKLSQIKTQVLDNLISNELLAQGVAAAGIKADPAEVEKQYQAILTQAGGAEKLQAEMVKNNLTEATLRENIAKQIAVQAYLLKNIDISTITVSDAEIAQFYADYSKAQKAAGQKTVPALKELSAQIKQQIITNKQQTLVVNFIAALRAKATIVPAATL